MNSALQKTLTEMARDLEGDAVRMVETLEKRSDDRAKGFLKKKTEQLRDFLAAEGYLDPRDVLDGAQLNAHVLAAMAVQVREGWISPVEVATITARLHRVARE